MISADSTVFPNNVVSLLKARFELVDPDLKIFTRPLRSTDPIQCLGIFAKQWLPEEDSYELLGGKPGRHEPTLQRYYIAIQAFIKDTDEDIGIFTHANLSAIIRTIIYRDEPLRIGLSLLSSVVLGKRETLKRWSVWQQRFFGNEIQGSWLYLSTLDMWVETEMD